MQMCKFYLDECLLFEREISYITPDYKVVISEPIQTNNTTDIIDLPEPQIMLFNYGGNNCYYLM